MERPYTYTQTNNADGTVNLNPAPGTVSEEGTPVSATNLNTIEEGLQHLSVAHDLAYSELQALLRDAIARIEVLEAQVAAL